MSTPETHTAISERPSTDTQLVTVHVNEKPVRMNGHRHSGMDIKQAAIGQGVQIQPDFVLYLLRHNRPNQPVGDDEVIAITNESRFHAIADDDNS